MWACVHIYLLIHPYIHLSIHASILLITGMLHSSFICFLYSSTFIHSSLMTVCTWERGLVTAVIGTGVGDERSTLCSIPKTILILAHPAMQVMHSLTTLLKHIHTMTALLSALSERERVATFGRMHWYHILESRNKHRSLPVCLVMQYSRMDDLRHCLLVKQDTMNTKAQ